MNGKALLRHLRRLCRDIDDGKPLQPIRVALRARVVPAAVALTLGAVGCSATQQEAAAVPAVPDVPDAALQQEDGSPGEAPDAAGEPEPTVEPPPPPMTVDCPELPPPVPAPTPPDRASRPGSTPPRVRLGEARVLYGIGFQRETIRRVVRQRNRQFRACYESRLAERPELTGRVTVRWTIAIGGEVTQAEVVSSTLGDEAAELCVLCTVQRMRFPSSDHGSETVVTYPFNFLREQ